MPTPSTLALSVLKQKALHFVKRANDTNANTLAGQFIRDAVVRFNTRPWRAMLTYTDTSLTTSFSTLSLPTDFLASNRIFYLNSSNERGGKIKYLRPENFLDIYSENEDAIGSPEAATVVNFDRESNLQFNCVPDSGTVSAYPKIRHYYYAKLAELSFDTSTLAVRPEVEDFLVWSAASDLAAIYDPEKYPIASQKSEEAWMRLMRQESLQDEQNW